MGKPVTAAAMLAALFAAGPAAAALVQSFTGTGTYGLEMDAEGIAAGPAVSSMPGSTLDISVQASAGTPVQAYLYAMDVNHNGGMTATFNGQPVPGGAVEPYAVDSGFQALMTFRWDVTTMMMPGITNYSWSFSETPDQFNSQGSSIGLVALAYVYSDAGLPLSTATIADGMTYVGNTAPETETFTFSGLPAGQTAINLLTYFDDNNNPPGDTGEVVTFNGGNVGGPLDGNLALNGSLTAMSGTAQAGSNLMSIQTNTDQFGWVVSTTLTPVPLPPAAWLFGAALAALAGRRR